MAMLRRRSSASYPPQSLPKTQSTWQPSTVTQGVRHKARLYLSRMPLKIVAVLAALLITVGFVTFNLRHPAESQPGGNQQYIKEIVFDNPALHGPFVAGCRPIVANPEDKVNAAFVVLARNQDQEGLLSSIASLERHFNQWYNYPYIFLNDEPFNATFKAAISKSTAAKTEFGVIPDSLWDFDDSVDRKELKKALQNQADQNVMYGDSESYHKMCRFYSGKFYDHPLLKDLDWYWRLEPDVQFFCDLTYDPFRYMQDSNKVYGYNIAIKELKETVPNLWRYTKSFKQKHKMDSKGMWEMFLQTAEERERRGGHPLKDARMSDKNDKDRKDKEQQTSKRFADPDYEDMGEEAYNMCHFWSNFEIGKLSFFRSQEYRDYFDYLEEKKGFWSERWGDAPVHSLAVGLFLKPSEVHYFRDIGYQHSDIFHCPYNAKGAQLPAPERYWEGVSKRTGLQLTDEQIKEDEKWLAPDPAVEGGVGCRCICPLDKAAFIEPRDGSCIAHWVETRDKGL
ncbi:O-glycoside alpha-1,2-mannosyltransferase-like protein 4 [Yarrowia sp. B02]|nr:O-glycoside alpha-1,2-mannosyltransferase-like protein 4 [Yarrowia sp. B02]